MRNIHFGIFFITFPFIAIYSYGQQVQKKYNIVNQKHELNIDNISKFNLNEQTLKDSLKKDVVYRDTIVEIYPAPTELRCEKEVKCLLKKYRLNYDSVFYYVTDAGTPWNKIYKLKEHIKENYGLNFIDSLLNVAEKQYVQNNINKVFDYHECDTTSRYSGANYYVHFSKAYQLDFWKTEKYPTEFKYRNDKDKYSYLIAEFILHKDGKVSDIEADVTFQNDQNKKYSTYFRRELIKFIQKSKWTPAKSAGITVTSKVPIVIFFK